MANKGKPKQVERVTQRLNSYLTRVSALVALQKKEAGAILAPPPRAAPTTPAPAVEEAPLLPERAKGEGGKEARIKVDRRARLKMTLGHHAINHPARLRAVLKTAPESAKPALRRAIAVSETGYKQAIEALD